MPKMKKKAATKRFSKLAVANQSPAPRRASLEGRSKKAKKRAYKPGYVHSANLYC